ncbi:hypothetical protein NQ314_016935 [Rhamnusium bicolor]|uniref:protein-histidine N-methyltransferase n=1 Tax=Rhamnusium bicolor TaxID=1586634 RepID=A0AAV8WUR1_9CUCU|nr:hypothetical protein NQ314_016935 [Rhamnusium bicolor]
MFKFGFSSDNEGNIKSEENIFHTNDIKWDESTEIEPNKDRELVKEIIESTQVNTIMSYNVEIKYLSSNEVLKILQNKQSLDDLSTLKAEHNHSDLLPAVYEGGLKIWECTFDLLNYINDNQLNFEHKNVLDLGCGAGIIGILSLLKGSTCYFQDYNSDVIRYITIPNVLLNAKDSLNRCKFFCGDWQSFSYLLETDLSKDESKFDYIFTSETIYNIENYAKLHHVFEKLLKKNGAMYPF